MLSGHFHEGVWTLLLLPSVQNRNYLSFHADCSTSSFVLSGCGSMIHQEWEYWDSYQLFLFSFISYAATHQPLSSLSFSLLKYLFIYLTVSGFSCGTWDLHCSVWDLSLWCVDSVIAVHGLSCFAACGILLPWPGIKPPSPALQGRFLTTGPPGKSWQFFSFNPISNTRPLKGAKYVKVCVCVIHDQICMSKRSFWLYYGTDWRSTKNEGRI